MGGGGFVSVAFIFQLSVLPARGFLYETDVTASKLKKNGKPHPYIFKWYASAYIILAIIVTYLEYDNWFTWK